MWNTSKESGSRNGWDISRGPPIHPQTRSTVHHTLAEEYNRVGARILRYLWFPQVSTQHRFACSRNATLDFVSTLCATTQYLAYRDDQYMDSMGDR